MSNRMWECHQCGRHYDSQNELKHHEMTHLPLPVRCLACPRKFARFADVVIHLEAGTCASGVNVKEVNRTAAMCFQWKKYLSKEYQEELLDNKDGYRKSSENKPYKCPRCEDDFPLLSSLFNHIWSGTCGQGFNGAPIKKLRRWLSKRFYHYTYRTCK